MRGRLQHFIVAPPTTRVPGFIFLTRTRPPRLPDHADQNFRSHICGGLGAECTSAIPAKKNENYGFKPAPRVRTFGQILGHVAEEQYFFCSSVKGEQKAADVEKAKTSKADLLATLRDSFAYCDAAYDGVTDATAIQMIKVGQSQHTRLRMLWGNTVHDNSHYGNLVTYLRIKGLVPPSTEGN